MKHSDQASYLKNWLVIINPNAGTKKGEKDWPKIAALLDTAGFDYTPLFTTHRNHAIELSSDHINRGFKKIIVVGGDGTLNEVVNGVLTQGRYPGTEILVGMIMVGTGNDWSRTFNIPGKYKKAIKVIRKHKTFLHDAGKVTYHDKNPHTRYFINMAGLGYDGLVAHKTNQMKEKGRGGTFAYLISLLLGLFEYSQSTLEIDIDGENIFTGKVFSMSVGICKYNGGGMMQCPYAIPDDGIFDITLIKSIHKYQALLHLKKLYSGHFEHLPFIQIHKGKVIRIRRKQGASLKLESDGESLGHAPYDFEIIPRCLNMIIKEVEAPL